MATKKYTVHEVPLGFQTKILSRFMGEAAVRELYEQYKGACHKTMLPVKPSPNEFRLASLAKDSNYGVAAAKVGVDIKQVYRAVNRVSKYTFFFPAEKTNKKQ